MLDKVRAVLRAAPKPFQVCGLERVWGLCGRPADHDGHHEPLPEPDEHVAALADQVKLMSRNREPGLHIKCYKCGELLTEPGPLRLHIGTPDEFGQFTGRKIHLCNACGEWPDAIRIDETTGEPLLFDPLGELRTVVRNALDDINDGGRTNLRNGWSIAAATALTNSERKK